MKKLFTLMMAVAVLATLVGCAANPYASRQNLKSNVMAEAQKSAISYPVLELIQDPTTVIYGKMFENIPMTEMQNYGLFPQAMFSSSGPLSGMTTVTKCLVAVLLNQAKGKSALYVVMQGGTNQNIINAVFSGGITGAVVAGQAFQLALTDSFGAAMVTGQPSNGGMALEIIADGANKFASRFLCDIDAGSAELRS